MEVNNKQFAVFILTYGRPEKIHTLKTLSKQGYTGKIYLICSDDDKKLKEYQKNYNNVIVFSKKKYNNKFDIGDNFNDNRVVVFARNAVYDIAKSLNLEYFIVLDDDYTSFEYTMNEDKKYTTKHPKIKNLDKMFNKLLKYYISINVKTLCMAQGGDFIGGENSRVFKQKLSRKAMNFFVCSVNRPFKFLGRINEDVNTYVRQGTLGDLFLTVADLRLEQLNTQSNKGGLTEFYLDGGTYVKSFYTVLFSPSCTHINLMGHRHKRFHHRISWNNAIPKIINEQYKK
jgi:predicted glutamine amidotransferase